MSSSSRGASGSIGRWSLLVLLSTLVVPLACSKDKKEEASAEKASAAASAKKAKAERAEKKDKPKTPLEVPVIEDFEERAQRRITAENLEAELTKLEEEMGLKEPSGKDAAAPKKPLPVIAQPAAPQ